MEQSPKRISHSMLESYLQCGKKYYFSHVRNIEPDRDSRPLILGTIGHKILEGFFTAIKDGVESKQDAIKFAIKFSEEYARDDVFPKALALVVKWVAQHVGLIDRWEILVTEETRHLPIPGLFNEAGEQIEFPFTIDLVVRDRVNGKVFIVDHKFLYDFYDEELISLLPQIPKYAGALRVQGIPVDDAYYNMIRTRPMKSDNPDDLYRLTRLNLTDTRIKEAMSQQIQGMEEIVKRPKLPLRTVNKMNCGNCSFKELCILEANGEPIEVAIKHGYRQNSYGYEDV